jgi:uncharacterized protein
MSSLHTPDPKGAIAFYSRMFGWQPEPSGSVGAHIMLWRLPGYAGEAGQPIPTDVVAVLALIGDGPTAPPPHLNVKLRVEDIDATAQRAAELGGKVIAPPQDAAGFRSAVLTDPQGAVFSASQLTVGP